MIDLLQMREKHSLQDRVDLLGSVKPTEVRNVSLLLAPIMSACQLFFHVNQLDFNRF